MSQWHAIEGQVLTAEENAGITFERWPRVTLARDIPALSDALSDPDEELLADAHAALLPKGAAWGTPDNIALARTSNLWKFWRAVTEPVATAYRDLWRVAMDSTSLTLVGSLEDWEMDFGLPNPCLGPDQSDEQRHKWLRFKVLAAGVITPGDYLNLAAEVGSDIIIEEPEFFEFGHSDCGGPDEVAGPDAEHLIIIWPIDGGEYGFNIGEGTFSETLLYDFDGDQVLACVLPPLINSGYRLVLNYSYTNEFGA